MGRTLARGAALTWHEGSFADPVDLSVPPLVPEGVNSPEVVAPRRGAEAAVPRIVEWYGSMDALHTHAHICRNRHRRYDFLSAFLNQNSP